MNINKELIATDGEKKFLNFLREKNIDLSETLDSLMMKKQEELSDINGKISNINPNNNYSIDKAKLENLVSNRNKIENLILQLQGFKLGCTYID